MKIKKRSLFWEIIFYFTVAILITLISIWTINRIALRNFFTNETYNNIEAAQKYVVETGRIGIMNMMNSRQDTSESQLLREIRSVEHIIMDKNMNIVNMRGMNRINQDTRFIENIVENIKSDKVKGEYKVPSNNEVIYYKIREVDLNNSSFYLVSYLPNEYKVELENTLFKQLLIGSLIPLIVSMFFAALFSKRLSTPLIKLQKVVNKIAKRQWEEKVEIDRKDEIGSLAESIEKMRKKLIENDKSQEASLQYISHELKTPIMIMRSYTQSIKDGIFPKDDLESSLDVIEKESLLLEKRIKDMILFSKLKYISGYQKDQNKLNLKNIITDVYDRFKDFNENIKWNIDLEDVEIKANEEQWTIIFENILENFVRYANNIIEINLEETDNSIVIRLFNDGPKIEKNIFENIFFAYEKGKKGENGLGLAIVKRIVNLYGGKIYAKNEKNGVAFYIEIER
ncbi:sensor histidine kinase [Geotoga petraea]|jgi:two-component system sensor histidine kinase CssS|uniref:histidine kinase n=1 Tax=Geotoga petraea TaxID=28234 RepID=A0A1G6KWZ7_9BACT|nr:HAMP domain-containing sensor histidine kinase [Geotoga petraea]MDK2946068.1 two-component system, OmpR family, sensor histidine kinase CssS [Geotoga sp.]TGG88750.1 HAMP domain-containing histidine kinase [Geotoga petraea]SDC34906.1 two-component system, OmpR family, sensor histidine kinase CssS [Geotoga petraea]